MRCLKGIIHIFIAMLLSTAWLSCSGPSGDANMNQQLQRLVVGTMYSPTGFFILKGDTLGYDYDRIKEYAQHNNLYLEFRVGSNLDELIEMLRNGQIDIIATEVPNTTEYRQKVLNCGSINETKQILVQNAHNDLITDVTQLAGKDVYVGSGTPSENTLRMVNSELGGLINIHPLASDSIEADDLMEMVSKNKVSLAVVNSDMAQFNKERFKDIDITKYIEENVRVENVLKTAAPLWDGGYVVCGQTGSGEMFTMRDPHGIRPSFYYKDEEILVVASERPAIQTAFNIHAWDINELAPGEALIVSKDGDFRVEEILEKGENKACSFERIYFSRGSDIDIYKERKMLGRQLREDILKSIDYDIENTVFSFIPNTAEVAFYGMLDGFKDYLNEQKIKQIEALGHKPTHEELCQILSSHIRSEKVAIKDIKLRTFITESNSRNDLAAHVYDITYGSLRPFKDNLVIIDDSIVRGTTLKESIIRILDRLHPKKIVIVSSSPQVRYPDYYGIDMARMEEFIAFRATIELLKNTHQEQIIHNVYKKCKAYDNDNINYVKAIYKPFTAEEISFQMVKMLKSEDVRSDVEMIFQSLEGLHKACPNHPGDWYFSGDYPTPGGVRLVCKAYVDWYEKSEFANNGL